MVHEHKTISYKGKVVFEKVVMDTYKRIPKLFQEKEACFMFVNRGAFSVRTQEDFISFEKGEGLLAKCFNYFFETDKKQREEEKVIEVVGILLHPLIVKEMFLFDMSHSDIGRAADIKKVELYKLLLNFKESITILLDHPDLVDETLVLTKLKEFILLIAKSEKTSSELAFLTRIFSPVEYDIKKAVENNLYSDLSLADYAKLCNMSLASFNRKFKNLYHQSPKKYIAQKKLEKACRMLSSPEYRITDIAYECGFESISTFNRAFKKHFQKSPSEYRRI